MRKVPRLSLEMQADTSPNSYISRNSAAGYFSTFRALLKIAYKEKMLRENLTISVSAPRKPRLRQHSPSATKHWNYVANGAKD